MDMSDFLKERCAYLGKAVTNGLLYDLGFYPGMVLAETPNKVYGDVYQLSDEDAAFILAKTDEFEGVGPDFDFPNEYKRQLVDVQMLSGEGGKIKAWVYLYNRQVQDEIVINSGDYVDHILRFKAKDQF